MKRYAELIRKSIAASVLIGLGDYVLLMLGNELGAILFSLGLLGVCTLQLNLFTGKCGFLIEDKISIIDLLLILIVNLVSGWIVGFIFSLTGQQAIVEAAKSKASGWDFSLAFFIRSVLCGMIMYLAVATYRKGTKLGILMGVPLFILCGFQHCIANIITLGVARTWSWTIILCILGNFFGSLLLWWLVHTVNQTVSAKSNSNKGE